MKIISNIIVMLSMVCLSTKKENISLSNLFNNQVKRDIRNRYSYNREYYIEVSE